MPTLLNQKETAEIIRKPPRWLERKRQEGGGPVFLYIGRTPYYRLEDVLAWINAQRVLKHTSERQ
ncbi:MAG: helix-turn-helix domain-containing protein [Gammaproteobacteria bacterium]|nr:helix-turn-helix domain-containing protein [Gammaproteobacteria bacterium]